MAPVFALPAFLFSHQTDDVSSTRIARSSGFPARDDALRNGRRRFIGNRAGEGVCALTCFATAQSDHLNDPRMECPSGSSIRGANNAKSEGIRDDRTCL